MASKADEPALCKSGTRRSGKVPSRPHETRARREDRRIWRPQGDRCDTNTAWRIFDMSPQSSDEHAIVQRHLHQRFKSVQGSGLTLGLFMEFLAAHGMVARTMLFYGPLLKLNRTPREKSILPRTVKKTSRSPPHHPTHQPTNPPPLHVPPPCPPHSHFPSNPPRPPRTPGRWGSATAPTAAARAPAAPAGPGHPPATSPQTAPRRPDETPTENGAGSLFQWPGITPATSPEFLLSASMIIGRRVCGCQIGHGSKLRAPSEHPNPTTKID